MSIQQVLKEGRLAADLTQKELAGKLGYNPDNGMRYISRWETGIKPIPSKHIVTISRILNIPIHKLLP